MIDHDSQTTAFYDLGGEGPIIHLAHANGFPPGTRRPLADALSDHYRVIALLSRPFQPSAQPQDTPTWPVYCPGRTLPSSPTPVTSCPWNVLQRQPTPFTAL
jgi:hypothetical protein